MGHDPYVADIIQCIGFWSLAHNALPLIVSKGFVRLSHAVGVVFLFNGRPLIVKTVHQFAG